MKEQIYAALEAAQEPPRFHLGASEIGHHCERWLWIKFRWAIIEKFPGRVLRLFRRGQAEEQFILDDLNRIGLKVIGDQRRVELFPHFGGSLDGILIIDGKQHVLEMKTHSLASFKDLERNKVLKSKPQHYAQMQVYMKGISASKALYFAVCKDNDSIYTEWVDYDSQAADALVARAKRIILSDEIPAPISTDPTWYQCKMCAAHSFCHEKAHTKEVNCRTCAHSLVKHDGWHCDHWNATIPQGHQYDGCPKHVLHPDLVPWPIVQNDDDDNATYKINDTEVVNGPGGIPSKELVANPLAFAPESSFVKLLRDKANADVIE